MAEYTSYGSAVTAAGAWTDPANVVGTPDGVYATCTTVSSFITQSIPAFSAIPDDAVLLAVVVGARAMATGNTQHQMQLNLGDTAAKVFAILTANVPGDFEVAVNVSKMTVAMLKSGTLTLGYAKNTSLQISSLDAVWVRVVTYGGTTTDADRVYASSAVGSFTNPENVVGPPDGVYATTTVQNNYVRPTIPGLGLSGVFPLRVWMGLRRMRSGNTASTLTCGVGDKTAYTLPSVAAFNVPEDTEVALDITKFSTDILNAPFFLTHQKTGSTAYTFSDDAFWVRAQTIPATTIGSYGTALVGTTPANWTTPANAVGAPDALVATNTGSSTNPLVLALDGLLSIPDDATIVSFVIGMRCRVASSTASFRFEMVSSDPSVAAIGSTPSLITTSLADYTYTAPNPTAIDVAALKDPGVTQGLQVKRISGNITHYLDAVWYEAVYVVPPSPSRMRRWDGSQWAEAPLKRWDGSQWVTTTIKRWDGTSWV